MKFSALLLISVVSMTTACNQEQSLKAVEKTHVHKKDSTVFTGKPQAPVTMSYEFLTVPAAGEILQILLTFKAQQDSEMLQINYRPSEHLESADATQQKDFTKLAKGSEATFIINVIPTQETMAYVNVFASTSVMGKKQSRAFAIPVSFDLALPSSVILKKNPQSQLPAGFELQPEQNVIIMPATESP